MTNYNEMIKIQNNISRNRILCPNCGHSVIFSRKDKVICRHCGKYVFKNKEIEFKHRLKEEMKRQLTN